MPKRKPRNKLGKPAPDRHPYDRVLIVCKGTKTEPYYLEELRDHFHLSTANIEVIGSGTDPESLVNKAIYLKRNEKKRQDGYDKVYCVFDRDSHPGFSHASEIATTNGINLARSWPCFEYWILLHFSYTRKPYMKTGQKSAADNCIEDLKKEMPHYAKGSRELFKQLLPCLTQAKQRASRALMDAQKTQGNNPSTEFHLLVCYLLTLISS